MGFLQQLIFLYLASNSDCIEVIKYKPTLDGSFTISNVSLDNLAEFSLCLRVFSYSFSGPERILRQSLVTVGERTLLGILTHQHCQDCNTSESRFLCFYLLILFYPSQRYEVVCSLGTRESESILQLSQI